MVIIVDTSIALGGNERYIKCEDMRDNIYKLGAWCKRDNKAGGISFLDQGSHIVLY